MKKLLLIAAVFISVLIAFHPAASLESARDALSLCAEVVLPSLFPFLVCSNLIVALGGANVLTGLASNVMQPLFKIRGAGALPLILGLLSGYPCGAATACNLYSQGAITRDEAHRLLSFTNNSGPLFIISAVGIGIYKNVSAGVILYIAHILAALTVGVLSRFFSKEKKEALPQMTMQGKGASAALSESVHSMLNLCGYVVFFSVLLTMLQKCGIITLFENTLCLIGVSPSIAALLARGIFEITTALSTAKCVYLPAVAAVISLGGISVLFQTMSFTKKHSLSIKPYIIGKIFAGGFSALYTGVLLHFFPLAISVFSPLQKAKAALYVPYLFSFLLAAFIFVAVFIKLSPQDGKSPSPERQNSSRTRS